MQAAFEIPEQLAVDVRIPRARRLFGYRHGLKRFLDVLMATLGMVGSLPLWLVIAIAIKLDSPGPLLHVQERVGLNGRRFRFYKFRSMHVDAEERLQSLLGLNEVTGPVFKMRNDPRVTRVGAILRRSSLDELPQLINVLLGEMSLVGPRPPLPREVEQYRLSDYVRLSVKPGLTCFWQISGRSNVSFDQWMELDRTYVQSVSLKVDLAILVRTVWAVLSCRGAF